MRYTANTLCLRPQPPDQAGVYANVTPERAGWQYLHMTARRLRAGQIYRGSTGAFEFVHVILGGVCAIRTSAGDFPRVGRRAHVFDGMPYALYLSRGVDFEIEALSDTLDLATCGVPTEEDHPARLITPADCAIELRGGGNASRQINSIIPPGFGCQRLVCVEVYTPGGNWSSYPPHKHDVHRVAADGTLLEADLEEIYFYKIDRPEGYAYQRVYTEDGSIDALMLARSDDIVLVPAGYHPVVSAHGYTTYYLNFLAGSAQSLANSDDPAHAWVKTAWGPLDPRLPLVSHAMEAPERSS
jgi:5-deoxy-glucuronate isomerase